MSPTHRRLVVALTAALAAGITAGAAAAAPRPEATPGHSVTIDVDAPGEPISPLIRGISGMWTVDEMRGAGITLNSWGGNPNTRYNFILGNAWNAARDWQYQNVDYDGVPDAFGRFSDDNIELGIATRLAVPTLGWVAKDTTSCSFPTADGGCATPAGDCENPGTPPDPELANVRTTEADVVAWVTRMLAEGRPLEIVAMDNEPELWGFTHYDVHPTCTTMDEVLQRHLTYGQALRDVAPDAKLAGPVACCWFDYWHTAPTAPDGSANDYIGWFLRSVRDADSVFGRRTLDYLDVHFYPQDGSYSEHNEPEVDARRLRSTRSLWDPTYSEESWIDAPIAFIPRMHGAIDANYPDTELLISEWNFGADGSVNGALAIADTLAIFGREGVDAAAYWRSPAAGSAGYYAFKMHGNYDDDGSAFVGATLPVDGLAADDLLAVYGALDTDAGLVRVMLINKDPDAAATVDLELGSAAPTAPVERFTFGQDAPGTIVADTVDLGAELTVAAYSIVLLEIPVVPGA